MSRPAGRSAARIAGPVFGVVGLFVLVAGTFLPWLTSGQARRNSYQTGGALRRLLGLPGVLDAAVSAWPFVGLVCAAVVVLFAAGMRRWSAVLGLLTALATGAVAIAALRVDSTFFVRPERFGPAVTVAGSAALLVGASVQLITARLLDASRGST